MAWDWDNILESSTIGGQIIAGLAGIASITTFDATTLDVFERSTHNGVINDGPWLHEALFDTSTSGSQYTSAQQFGDTVGFCGLVGIVSSIASTTGGGNPGDIIIAVFKRNATPYTRIEKRADALYHMLHKKQLQKSQAPVLLATTKDAMDGVNKLFGNDSVTEMTETLSVLEGLLEKREVQ